jgi:uncharacterized OB-fold protein
MLAVFGIGLQEMLILGMLMVGVPTVVIVWWLSKNWIIGRPLAKPCRKCGMLAPERGFCPHCGIPVDPA